MEKEIIESLQKECIWIVPNDLKNEYERMLVERSEHQALLFQRVTTISLFYQELLRKNGEYGLHPITQIEKIKVIYQLIQEGKYHYITINDLPEVSTMLKSMIEYCVESLPDLTNIPAFTKEKLMECYAIYQQYLDYLKKHHYYDGNYNTDYQYDLPIYVAGFGKITTSEKRLLDHFNVTYVKEDQTDPTIDLYQFVNKKTEIKTTCHDIVKKINQGASIDEFMIYAPSTYIELLQTQMKKYAIPFNGQEEGVNPFQHIIRMIGDYLVNQDESLLISLMYWNQPKEVIYQADYQYKTGRSFYGSLKNKILGFRDCKTMKEFSLRLVKLLSSISQINSNEHFGEIVSYITSFDLEENIILEDYFNILLAFFPKLVVKYHSINALNIDTIQDISPAKKYTYFLGCNEEVFPSVSKDSGLLLNEGKVAFGIPSLIDEIENEKNTIERIISHSNHIAISYPIGEYDGTELLKSAFIEDLAKKYPIQKNKVVIQEIASVEAEKDLLLQINHESIMDAKQLGKAYHSSKNQPDCVMVSKPRDLSVSEVEVYNGCPFKYFINYDLHIRKWKNNTMQKNDYGTLRHDINEACSLYINGQEQDIDSIIHNMCEAKKEEVANNSEQIYYIDSLEKEMKLTVRILRYQNTIGNYEVTGHEVDVKKDLGTYSLHGRFDRKDTFDGYARIIDYKSSKKTINQDLAKLGFNIQMLLYLDMLEEKAAGVLYFNMASRMIKDAKVNQVKSEDLLKQYKMNGLIVADEDILEAMNPNQVKDILPIRYNKDGISESNTSLIQREKLDELLETIYQQIDSFVAGIFDQGNIRIDPASSTNQQINHIVNPCTYCDYGEICLKDIFYNTGREIIIGGEEDETGEDE